MNLKKRIYLTAIFWDDIKEIEAIKFYTIILYSLSKPNNGKPTYQRYTY